VCVLLLKGKPILKPVYTLYSNTETDSRLIYKHVLLSYNYI